MKLGMDLKQVLGILLGTAIFACGLVHFNMQNNLAEGGVTGIGLILYQLFDFKTSVTNTVINLPLFILAWFLLGRKSFVYTMIGTFSLSGWLLLFETYHLTLNLQEDLMLASILAGTFVGVGLGITFRFGGTTGGSDIIAKLVEKYTGISIGKTILFLDVIVIGISFLTYLSYKEGLYTLIAVVVGSKLIDYLQVGGKHSKGAMVISNKHEEIAKAIMSDMQRGVTVLKGYGSYSKKDCEVLHCVIEKDEMRKLKDLILSIDSKAFVSIYEVNDVMGKGFSLDESYKPLNN